MKNETCSILADGLRVLVVEDHADSAIAISRLLRSFGYKAQIARDLKSAVELADRDSFDLLISDIRLPDGSGLDLMRQLRIGKSMKGIAVSGLASDADRQESAAAGFSAHLGKPLDFSRLRETIDRVCAGSLV